MNGTVALSKYLLKEMATTETLLLVGVGIGLSVVIGSSIYIAGIGINSILQVYNISISAKVVNFVCYSIGANSVSNILKTLCKNESKVG